MLTETTTPVTPSAAAIPTVVVLQCMDGCEFAVPYSQVKGQAAGIVALFAASKSKAPLVESTTPTSPLKLIKEDGETATMSVPHVSSFILSKGRKDLNQGSSLGREGSGGLTRVPSICL